MTLEFLDYADTDVDTEFDEPASSDEDYELEEEDEKQYDEEMTGNKVNYNMRFDANILFHAQMIIAIVCA